jgi:zinc protease
MTRRTMAAAAALIALLLTAFPAAPASGQAIDWKQIAKPRLHNFSIPKPKRVLFPNGMVLFLLEDRELPLIEAFAVIRGGGRNEPADKAGLSQLFGQTWRTGGTKTKTGDELDDFLEARAAKVETSSDIDSAEIRLSCLKGDFDAVLGVFDDVLRQPAFREDKLAIAKNQINTGIARRNDNPQGIAEREAGKLGFGADSPYARVLEYATVASVTQADLVAWHARYVHPNRIVMGVVGDFDAAAMETKLRKRFGGWAKGDAVNDPPAKQLPKPKPGVYFVAKDDVNQSNIRMVGAGIRRDNPDYFAVQVFNEVLGGGFSSRLFSNVRSKKGLAYGVGGGIGSNFDHPGLLRLALGTKSETTAAGIDALLEEVKNIVDQPPTAEELQKAKEAILNSFIFRFDSKAKILREQTTYEFYGYPADFLDKYRREIEKVTAADVARVAKKYIHKEDLAILVVGKAADFERPLSSFGTVTPIDITIPQPGGEKKAAAAAASPASSPASKDAGKALLAKAIEGLGGAANVAKVKDYRMKGKTTVQTPQGEMALAVTLIAVPPDRLRQEVQAPFGTMTTVVSPAGAYMAGPMGTQDLPGSAREEVSKEMKRSAVFLAQHASDPKLTASAAGAEKVGAIDANVLDLSYEGSETRWYVDPASGHIVRSSYMTVGQAGPGKKVTDYSDFRTVSGVTFAFQHDISVNGEKSQSMTVEDVQLNSAPDPSLFEKPKEEKK